MDWAANTAGGMVGLQELAHTRLLDKRAAIKMKQKAHHAIVSQGLKQENASFKLSIQFACAQVNALINNDCE